jgi:hypothetical protein
MRRKLVTTERFPEVVLYDVSADHVTRIERSIERFLIATPHNNDTFCDLLSDNFKARRIGTEALERLSVWCHTNQPPDGVSDAAQELARELLGVVPTRLRDQGTKRVDDYDTQVAWLATNIGE